MIQLDSRVRVSPRDGSEPIEGTAASISHAAIVVTREGEPNVTVKAADFDTIEQIDPPPGTEGLTVDGPMDSVAPDTTPHE